MVDKIKRPVNREILAHFDDQDPVLANVIRKVGDFQLKKNRKYFLVLCKAIVSQQISTSAAETIYKRFHALFDGKFPTPDRVGELKDAQMRSAGLSRQKISYLKDLSLKFADQTVNPHKLPWFSNEEVICQLTQVHGIGRWTAEMFLIFSLNRLDVLPVDDLGLKIAIKKIYRKRKLPSVKAIRILGRKWHPFETIATWYAWRFLDGNIVAY